MMDQTDVNALFPRTFIDEGFMPDAEAEQFRNAARYCMLDQDSDLICYVAFNGYWLLDKRPTRPSGLGAAGAQLQAPYT